ncbi:Kinesin- protein 12 [Irineochytrium annulatum]|nr:Kinesin- protein 12 [Irineochytrium annulatum]
MAPTTSSHIRVVVRVRPFNEAESNRTEPPAIEVDPDKKTILVRKSANFVSGLNSSSGSSLNLTAPEMVQAAGGNLHGGNGAAIETRELSFNRVCGDRAGQNDVFDECGIADLVKQALSGYAATVFAFGQTGSGKTFTITGPEAGWDHSPENAGIIPRALQFLFSEVIKMVRESNAQAKYVNGNQPQRQSTAGSKEFKVRAAYLEIYNEQVQDLLNPGGEPLPIRWSAERGFYVENLSVVECVVLDDCMAVLEEGLRNRKTASHGLNEHSSRSHSIMTIYITSRGLDPIDGKPIVRHGKISFVDLAGSERVKASKAKGETLTETLNINKSLLTLAKKIKNRPVVVVDPILDVVLQLKREVRGLRRENAELRARAEGQDPKAVKVVEGFVKLPLLKSGVITNASRASNHGPEVEHDHRNNEKDAWNAEVADVHNHRKGSRNSFLPRTTKAVRSPTPSTSSSLRSSSSSSMGHAVYSSSEEVGRVDHRILEVADNQQDAYKRSDPSKSGMKGNVSTSRKGARSKNYVIPSHKTNRGRHQITTSPPPLPPVPKKQPLPGSSRAAKGSGKPAAKPPPEYNDEGFKTTNGMLPLGSIREVAAVKDWIMNDVKALEREIMGLLR